MAVMTAELATAPRRCGAPTLYRDEYPDMLVEYFLSAQLPDKPDSEQPAGKGSHKAALTRVYSYMPTFEGFGRSIGVSTKVMYDWLNRHSAFREAHARGKDIMAEHLSLGLVTGVMNPTGAIFVAKNLVGWKDKTEVETINSQDTEDANAMRSAFAHATPAELAQVSALISQMQARVRLAVTESPVIDTDKPAP